MPETIRTENDFTKASPDRLVEEMGVELDKAEKPEVKFLAAKNKLQTELMLAEVAKTADMDEEEWFVDYAGFLSLVLDTDLHGPNGEAFRTKMLNGQLSDEDKDSIMSRVHELYRESLN